MSPTIHFDIPVVSRISSDLDRARAHNLEWSKAHGLITGDAAVERYSAWRMAELGALSYPDAKSHDLDLAVDALGWFTLFDDQFDGPLGSQPDELADVTRSLIAVMDPSKTTLERCDSPVLRAWADLWSRITQGMSEDWRARAARSWAESFWGFMSEAECRLSGSATDFDMCLLIRSATIGTYPWMSLVERTVHCELPGEVAQTPRLQAMLRITAELSVLVNDVFSIEREKARNDPVNLIVVLEDRHHYPRHRALEALLQMAHDKAQRLMRLAGEIPVMLDALRVSAEERDKVSRFVRGLLSLTRGHYDWYAATERYGAAEMTPADRPGYSENILAKRDPAGRPHAAV